MGLVPRHTSLYCAAGMKVATFQHHLDSTDAHINMDLNNADTADATGYCVGPNSVLGPLADPQEPVLGPLADLQESALGLFADPQESVLDLFADPQESALDLFADPQESVLDLFADPQES
eukprot:g32128.t1